MARRENPFALLDGEECDDLSTILQRVAAKVEASSRPSTAEKKKKKMDQQPQSPSAALKLPSKTLPPVDYVRAGRGRVGRGRGSGRSSGNDVKQFENGHPIGYQQDNGWVDIPRRSDGYQRDNGHSDGYRQYDGRSDGYRREDRRSDGYRRDNGRADNYSSGDKERADGNHQDYAGGYQQNYGRNSAGFTEGRGRRGGGRGTGRGRGREIIEDQGFGNEVRVVDGNHELEIQGQEVRSGRSRENSTEGQSYRDEKLLSNGNRNYGGERRWNGGGNQGSRSVEARSNGGREGRNNARDEVIKSTETKEVLGNKTYTVNGENSCDAAQENVHVTNDDAAGREERKRQYEEEKKKMTLEQYEKLLLEKRKALIDLKTQERKVALDKDFESMQVVDKKNEADIFIKLNSEKDKIKKKGSIDRDEKVCKAVSINEFLKPAENERRRGQYLRRPNRWVADTVEDVPVPASVAVEDAPVPVIEDPDQFPVFDPQIRHRGRRGLN